MDFIQRTYIWLYYKCLYDEKAQSKNNPGLDDGISNVKSIKSANNYDQF